jgi:hypothetical protein
MRAYAQYVGQVRRDGDYQWWPLDGGHRALGDCQATLHLIRGMAETHTAEEEASSVLLPDEWQALQLAYQAGEAGIRRQRGADGYISYAGLRVQVWTYLEEREFIHGEWRGDGDEDRWLFLTAAGRQFYEQHSATQDATARPPEPAAQPDAD